MKTVLISSTLLFASLYCSSQDNKEQVTIARDKNGTVKSIVFPESSFGTDIPQNADLFFEKFLKPNANDHFKCITHKVRSNYQVLNVSSGYKF